MRLRVWPLEVDFLSLNSGLVTKEDVTWSKLPKLLVSNIWASVFSSVKWDYGDTCLRILLRSK